jgi:hypothetical protein
MTRSKFVLGSILGLATIAGGVLIAQHPERDIGRGRPNLMEAQRLIGQAYDRLTAAQQANEWDMGGHAARAKQLLDQASHEVKLAAEEANHHRH